MFPFILIFVYLCLFFTWDFILFVYVVLVEGQGFMYKLSKYLIEMDVQSQEKALFSCFFFSSTFNAKKKKVVNLYEKLKTLLKLMLCRIVRFGMLFTIKT